jgi:hypothetical protein
MVSTSDEHLKINESGEVTFKSTEELAKDVQLRELATSVLPRLSDQWNLHSTVLLKRQAIARIIYYYELYKKIVDVPGVVCEFGVQYGATLAALINLRGMLEPLNYTRHIYGFDTFTGFAAVHEKDGGGVKVGDYTTGEDYFDTLSAILDLHEWFCRPSHIRNFTLVKGDATRTFETWLKENPHAVISMAIFDLDVYEPTRAVLQLALPRLVKGSLLIFDEFSCKAFPGETIAVAETLGLNNLALKRSPIQPYCAWAVFGD